VSQFQNPHTRSNEELREEAAKLRERIYELKTTVTGEDNRNVKEPRNMRRQIARIETVLHERKHSIVQTAARKVAKPKATPKPKPVAKKTEGADKS
jgi:ribosomal protein L29